MHHGLHRRRSEGGVRFIRSLEGFAAHVSMFAGESSMFAGDSGRFGVVVGNSSASHDNCQDRGRRPFSSD